jgi:hypothetical protein
LLISIVVLVYKPKKEKIINELVIGSVLNWKWKTYLIE